jgi:hypothetical protein
MLGVMRRGKQQIMHRFLPGKTFDFERVATIARVQAIRGNPRTDLNVSVVLRKIEAEAIAWDVDKRPALRDDILRNPGSFILLDPIEVRAELFPKVFRCKICGHIANYDSQENLSPRCPHCRANSLAQLRFVKVHRCGELQPLLPPSCNRCRTAKHMALDMRGSERLTNFRWICRNRGCNTRLSLYAGACPSCQWSEPNQRNMSIEVHRAGSTYYPHTTVLLNLPNRDLDAFLSVGGWQFIAAAKFLELPEVANRSLTDFKPTQVNTATAESIGGLTGREVETLTQLLSRGEITPERLAQEMQSLHQRRRQEQQSTSSASIAQAVVQRTGVSRATWEQAGQEMLEAVMPLEANTNINLYDNTGEANYQPAISTARRLGLSRVTLLTDFPMLTATYGYSRVDYTPNQCRLNPFPPQYEHQGKYPIFVDQVQADALLLSLDPHRLCTWLVRNGFPPVLPTGTDLEIAQRAYFVQLFTNTSLYETIERTCPQARMVFGLLHTLSHLCVRQAALLCGLDSTSLSEYILPRALTFAVYSNHRSGATIGALTALFEQTLTEWLNSIRDTRRCIYDPVCYDREGSCHACMHLAETSCRFFNLNLNRAFLFGGYDQHLGNIGVGYFDPSLA